MYLTDLVAPYVAKRNSLRPIGKELSDNSARHLRETCGCFSTWLEHRATLCDLNSATVNLFLCALLEVGRSPFTLKTRRTGLLMLWRFAVREGYLPMPPMDVRAVHLPDRQLDGYSHEAAGKLLAHALLLPGKIRRSKIPRKLYWPSAIRLDWDIGLRAGDIVGARVEHFKSIGALWARESKTSKCRWHKLRDATRDSIEQCIAINPKREFIWDGLEPRSFYRAFKTIAAEAGVGGTSRFIRRGASSCVEQENPGMGWRFLNHSSPAVFEKHYRVESICMPNALAPPELI